MDIISNTYRFLVIGFSVTAETNGFVEVASALLKDVLDIEILKVGFGGFQPHHVRYLVPEILAMHKPTHVILESSTPAFRLFSRGSDDHQATLDSIYANCCAQGINLAFLELPRIDVDFSTDWVHKMHKDFCKKYCLDQEVVKLEKGFIRDHVHPTDVGKHHFAEALVRLIKRVLANPFHSYKNVEKSRFGALRIADLVDTSLARSPFSRGGYSVDFIAIPQETEISVHLNETKVIVGITMLMGPQTGVLSVAGYEKVLDINCYDEYCYYSRLGARLFDQIETDVLTFTQLSSLPSKQLLKGEKDRGNRIGGLGHLLYENL